jgi:hypothetical protein
MVSAGVRPGEMLTMVGTGCEVMAGVCAMGRYAVFAGFASDPALLRRP